MSLLKWKEFAKSKTELGNKINYIHDLIKRYNISQKTSQKSFEKGFKPVTSKLDDVVVSNLTSRIPPQSRKQPPKKGKVPDYGIDIEDEVEDMNLGDLYDEQPIPPQQDKQLAPEPPQYEPLLEEIPEKSPPEYDCDEEIDYGILDEDLAMERLNELSLSKYQDLEEVYNDPEMARKNKLIYFQMTKKKAEKERRRLNGSKANVTKKYYNGEINEATRQLRNKKIDNDRAILTDYIKFNEKVINEGINKDRFREQRPRKKTERWKCHVFQRCESASQEIRIDYW